MTSCPLGPFAIGEAMGPRRYAVSTLVVATGTFGVCCAPADPLSTAMYSFPPALYAVIGATIDAPVLPLQRTFPLFVSKA